MTNARTRARDRALIDAARGNDLLRFERALAEGARISKVGAQALSFAAGSGNLPMVERLLQLGAPVDAFNGQPLTCAVEAESLPVVECVLRAGANVHTEGEWAVQQAARARCLPIVERLFEAGACADTAVRELARLEDDEDDPGDARWLRQTHQQWLLHRVRDALPSGAPDLEPGAAPDSASLDDIGL